MIHSNTMIKYLDLYHQCPIKNTIDYLFKTFSFKMNKNKIEFDQNEILIQDWTGWSKLEYIESTKLDDEVIKIKFNNIDIIVSKYQQFPSYNPSNITKGFHGETIFEHKIIFAKDITLKDNIRSRSVDENFINPTSIEFLYSNDKFYTIKTKSKYFNANEIYFYNDIL